MKNAGTHYYWYNINHHPQIPIFFVFQAHTYRRCSWNRCGHLLLNIHPHFAQILRLRSQESVQSAPCRCCRRGRSWMNTSANCCFWRHRRSPGWWCSWYRVKRWEGSRWVSHGDWWILILPWRELLYVELSWFLSAGCLRVAIGHFFCVYLPECQRVIIFPVFGPNSPKGVCFFVRLNLIGEKPQRNSSSLCREMNGLWVGPWVPWGYTWPVSSVRLTQVWVQDFPNLSIKSLVPKQ